MQSAATLPDQYISELPEDRNAAMQHLRNVINENLPEGFSERMTYGMLGWVVPHEIYPAGYHCTPQLPLPFVSIASQKNFIALYHMVLYTDKELYDWFVAEYPAYVKTKLDMGKGCVRFKNTNAIPYELIAQMMGKITVQQCIANYESAFIKK